MKPERMLIVINRKSGASDNSEVRDVIAGFLRERGIVHEMLQVSGEDPEREIREKVDAWKPDVITAAGGDGTINMVASVVAGMDVKLGIIPLGSANGLAYELGIPEKTEDALELLLKGEPHPMDLVRINDRHISLHLSDLGINARIVKAFEKEGKRGLKGYFKHLWREIRNRQPGFRCEIRTESGTFLHKSHMTIIANSSSYRTGANMNPKGKKDDGRFEVVVMKPHRRWVLRSAIGAFTGTLHKQPNVETYRCTSAVISVNPAQELQVDGESLGKQTRVTARIEKHALQVIVQV